MIELEKTYLIKYLPEGLENCENKEVLDIYIPASSVHPSLRMRRSGDRLEMTKKEPVVEGDSSVQEEQTIVLTEAEFAALEKIRGKRVAKTRYYYDYQGQRAEVDVFREALEGLAIVDFEFETEEAKENFKMPDFCLNEVTQEKFIAGGMLCGKSYADIESDLDRFGYNKLSLGDEKEQ